jgi:C1A family cysteine protease
MTIVGWTETHWIVLNSWGKNYGDKGFCYIPFDYPIVEVWAITDNITEVMYKMARFLDTEGHWAEEAIDKAADKGIVNGFDNNTFKPDEPITRA